MKQQLILATVLFGLFSGLMIPAAAAPWDEDGSDPFNDGVFADDWSPDTDDDSSEDDSSDDDDSNDEDDSSNNDDDEDAGDDPFTGGVFDDDWSATPDNSDDEDDDSSDDDSNDDTGDNDGNDQPDDGNQTNPGDGDDPSDGNDQPDDGNHSDDGDHSGELWGGSPPWEGIQHNEHYCYTHFHRDDFDEQHCGWELNVEKPPERGDSATEDRTLTEAPAPESLGLEWISYPNSRDVMPNPYTAQDQPSVKVCTMLLNQDNEPIVGNTVSDAHVSMDIDGVSYPEAHPASFDLPLTQYSDMLGTNPRMPEGDGWLDSECMEFANLAPGSFGYSQPDVTGSNADDIEFVGVTEYWDTTDQGDPFNQRVYNFGENDLSDGQFTLDTTHDGRHIELVYLFRLN